MSKSVGAKEYAFFTTSLFYFVVKVVFIPAGSLFFNYIILILKNRKLVKKENFGTAR